VKTKKISMVFLTLWMAVAAMGIWAVPISAAQAAPQDPNVLYYYCPMHTFEHSDKPGKCPICGMNLIPKRKAALGAFAAESGDLSEALKGLAPIDISPFQERMIDVKLAKAGMVPVIRVIQALGHFVIQGKGSSRTQDVTADVYVLDLPFVKVGQKVFVSSLNDGSRRQEGKVSHIYPYDQTSSGTSQVKIRLDRPVPAAIYTNVEIMAATGPRLAVPRDAVLSTGTQAYVYVTDGEGHFAPRAVEVGFKGDDLFEIVSGLKEGDSVAWGGTFMLDADAHIQGGEE